MKRFLLFAGQLYYPHGGWDDFIGSYDTREEAVTVGSVEAKKRRWDPSGSWYQIVDTTTMQAEIFDPNR